MGNSRVQSTNKFRQSPLAFYSTALICMLLHFAGEVEFQFVSAVTVFLLPVADLLILAQVSVVTVLPVAHLLILAQVSAVIAALPIADLLILA
jgi:hypothetical protein